MDNLDLLIANPTAPEARITGSPQGRSPSPVPFSYALPPSPLTLDSLAVTDLQPIGQTLFNALTANPALRDLIVANLTAASVAGATLRLRLQIDPPDLRRLPWEALYRDPGGYLALRDVSVARYIAVGAQTNRPVVTQLPLKILVVSAAPGDLPKLDFEAERKNLSLALADEEAKGWVKIEFVEHGRRQTVRDALMEFRPHVFHFSGHGSTRNDKASLALEDNYGDTDPIASDDVAVLFGGLPELRLIVLNACESAVDSTTRPLTGIAPKILQQAGVPAVVAMQAPVLDRAAIAFSRAFYNQLAQGHTIDDAMREGRLAIYSAVTNSACFAVPVLFLSADEGQLVEFPEQRRDRVVTQARKGFESVRSGPADDLTTQTLQRWQVNLGVATQLYKKLSAWKSLHDLLHDLNEKIEFVVLEIARLDKDKPDLTYVADHWANCASVIRALADFARKDAGAIVEKPYAETDSTQSVTGDPWIVDLIIAQRALEAALNESSVKLLAASLRKMRQAIQTHMNAADKQIQDSAGELHRQADRWADSKTLPASAELAAALNELARLHALLYAAVEKHECFQDLDNDFARLRDEARRSAERGFDWDAINAAWDFCRSDVLDSRFIPFAKKNSELIVNNGTLSGADWCVEVVRLADNLSKQVAAEEPAAVRTSVRTLGTAIRTHFFIADKELKQLTTTLDSLSDDLLDVLTNK